MENNYFGPVVRETTEHICLYDIFYTPDGFRAIVINLGTGIITYQFMDIMYGCKFLCRAEDARNAINALFEHNWYKQRAVELLLLLLLREKRKEKP